MKHDGGSRGAASSPAVSNAIASNRPAHRIVVANEKGGTGKSTTAVHIGVALSYLGARVTMLDLDPRQRTTFRYLENRAETMKKRELDLPSPAVEVFKGRSDQALLIAMQRLEKNTDFLIIDNPGRDDPFARAAVENADTLVTPLNDSFVDFDLIGQVDGETFKVKKLSFFAELVWEAKMKRSRPTFEKKRPEMDWVVVRNRTSHIEARNQSRIDAALKDMAQRVGFRYTQGLSERVIYRELFPSGLTLLDKGHLGGLGTSHLVARQELRELVKALKLPEFTSRRDEPMTS